MPLAEQLARSLAASRRTPPSERAAHCRWRPAHWRGSSQWFPRRHRLLPRRSAWSGASVRSPDWPAEWPSLSLHPAKTWKRRANEIRPLLSRHPCHVHTFRRNYGDFTNRYILQGTMMPEWITIYVMNTFVLFCEFVAWAELSRRKALYIIAAQLSPARTLGRNRTHRSHGAK